MDSTISLFAHLLSHLHASKDESQPVATRSGLAPGVIEIIFGINAERKSLESIARPLSFVEEEEEQEVGMAKAG